MANPKPSGFSNTKAGKAKILERTKALLESSSIVLTVPFEGVDVEQVDMLRKQLKKSGAKASVVKNSLIALAAKGTKFEPIGEGLKEENMFVFIPEGEAKGAYEELKKWQKEIKRTEPQFLTRTAIMEGVRYDGKGIDAVTSLPTKKELITKIAQGIKAVPTKVARGVKAVPNKLGRAFGALKDKIEKEGKAIQREREQGKVHLCRIVI